MKKRINLRLILIAGIAVIVTMVCMTGIYYKLFQGQVRKDLQINARLLSGTGLFDDPDNTNVSLSEYYEVGEDLRVTWIAKDGTVLFDNDLDISQLPNHKNRPEVKKALFQGEGESVRRSDTMQMDNYYYALRLENGTVIRVATQARSVYSVFLAASPFVMLILILIVSICIVLAHFLTKQLLHPIERLAENMEDTIEEPVYKELVPFVNTIRKQHENILMAAKVRQDFTANVSHELKTPISAIMMSLELLEDNRIGKLNTEQESLSKNIKENSDRLLEITGELLKMSQVESGKLYLNPKITKPIELIDYAIKANRVQAERFNCQIEVEYPEKITKLFVDSEKIAWVVTNLLSNAIRYSSENGRIIIGARQIDKAVEIYVKDFGKGIDSRYHESIFDHYFRVPGTKVQGSGLGLAISKDFVEAHGGTLSVDSAVGKGSTFVIKFNV